MTDARCILGIDPGASGAIAFYFTDAPDRVSVHDVPTVDGAISSALLADLIRTHGPSIAVIEAVSAMPGQGVSSMFNFGKAFGQAIGVVGTLKIPAHFVTPSKWKKHFRLSSDKEECRARALQLFPACAASFARKKDHGRAEAALIAKFGAETLFPWSAAA
jgi:crossover junction endodeoxyribonuclease RuvC